MAPRILYRPTIETEDHVHTFKHIGINANVKRENRGSLIPALSSGRVPREEYLPPASDFFPSYFSGLNDY